MTAQEIGLRFLGFEDTGGDALRARFDALRRGARVRIIGMVGPTGALLDLQSDDGYVGTSGDADLDALIAARVEAELVRARSAAAVASVLARQPGWRRGGRAR